MASGELERIIKKIGLLTPEEQLRLLAYLSEKAHKTNQVTRPHRLWKELYGAASYPLAGEDAQQWISRTRDEADKHRDDSQKRVS
jgi:hypothetical protein